MDTIILTGLARSGKDTAADYLSERHGFKKFVFSDVLEEELKKKGQMVTKMNMSRMGDELRNMWGMAKVAELLHEKVVGNEKVVLVGARSLEEAEFFRKKSEKFMIVNIDAEADARFHRRSEADANEKNKFFQRDEADLENKGLGKLIEKADFTVENNSDLEGLYKKLDGVVEGFK